jgi:hypothetical protein
MAHIDRYAITSLSPSQILLLRGEMFIQTAGSLELVSGARVSGRALAETALAAAFLGCAAHRILQLQVRAQRQLLVLRPSRRILAVPGPAGMPWPEATVEAQLVRLAAKRERKDPHTVRRLVYNLLEKDSHDPWRKVIAMIQEGLVEWWILERVEGVRGTTGREAQPVRLAPDILEPVLDIDIHPTLRLLQEGRSSPQLWGLLYSEIARGLADRERNPGLWSSGRSLPPEETPEA